MSESGIKELLARLDERLSNLLNDNAKKHEEIIEGVKNLASHVNDEMEVYNKRILDLEQYNIIERGKSIGKRELYKILGTILATAGSILTILQLLGRL